MSKDKICIYNSLIEDILKGNIDHVMSSVSHAEFRHAVDRGFVRCDACL
jgi:hypothetical protein